MDVTTPADGNVVQNETEQKLKYKTIYRDTTSVELEM